MRRQGGRHRLWRPVLALLVVVVLPWLVGAAVAPAPDSDAAHPAVLTHLDQSRANSTPGSHRATASAVPVVPFATVGLDAVFPAARASTAPPRFWHVHVVAASPVDAADLTASRGRSPPAAAL